MPKFVTDCWWVVINRRTSTSNAVCVTARRRRRAAPAKASATVPRRARRRIGTFTSSSARSPCRFHTRSIGLSTLLWSFLTPIEHHASKNSEVGIMKTTDITPSRVVINDIMMVDTTLHNNYSGPTMSTFSLSRATCCDLATGWATNSSYTPSKSLPPAEPRSTVVSPT